MNNLYKLLFLIFIIGIYSCKKDSKINAIDYSRIIVGKWADTKRIDTVIKPGEPISVDSVSIPLGESQIYTFNSDKTGIRDDGPQSIRSLHFNYNVSKTAFNFFNIQLYKPDGSPLNINQNPYTNDVVKFTPDQFVFRFVNTSHSPDRTVITLEYYTKIN